MLAMIAYVVVTTVAMVLISNSRQVSLYPLFNMIGFTAFILSPILIISIPVPNLWRSLLLVAFIFFIVPVIGLVNTAYLELAIQICLFAGMALGLNIVVGFAGLLDLGYVAFFASGAYLWGMFTSEAGTVFRENGWTVDPSAFYAFLVLGIIVAAIIGILLGSPVIRLKGDYLAIVTLGFGEIIRLFMLNLADLTNGPRGLLNIAPPTVFGYDLGNPRDIFILALLGSGAIAFVALRLERSRLGRAWVAIREDEEAAQAMGVPLVRAKLLAFAIGATFAGLAGQLYAARQVNIFPDNFTLFVSIDALALIIVGGMGSIPGVVFGALALKGLPEVLRGVDEYRIVAFAALLVIMMIARPEGILPAQRTKAELGTRAESQPGV